MDDFPLDEGDKLRPVVQAAFSPDHAAMQLQIRKDEGSGRIKKSLLVDLPVVEPDLTPPTSEMLGWNAGLKEHVRRCETAGKGVEGMWWIADEKKDQATGVVSLKGESRAPPSLCEEISMDIMEKWKADKQECYLGSGKGKLNGYSDYMYVKAPEFDSRIQKSFTLILNMKRHTKEAFALAGPS